MKTSAGLKYNNYVGAIHVKNMLKSLPEMETVNLKNIDINGQKRGCSGFIHNTVTDKYCYIITEHFFDGGCGSGLFGNPRNAIMMRAAKSPKDFTGGFNHWLPVEDISEMALKLTVA